MNHDEQFAQHRGLVFSIAYNLLGSVADAEDTTHNTYLRWRDVTTAVENPRAYLARIAANQALSLLRKIQSRRESYVGPWLPEPLITAVEASRDNDLASEPEHRALSSEAVSTALLVLLQSLSDDERIVFILREVFDFSFAEIAETVGKNEAAVRQSASRARAHVKSRRNTREIDPREHASVVSSFLNAVSTGDIQTLLTLVDPDVVLTSDGGGRVNAARKPVLGADNVIRFLLGIVQRDGVGAGVELREINGLLAIIVSNDTGVFGAVQLDVADGRVRNFFITVNPEKLTHLQPSV